MASHESTSLHPHQLVGTWRVCTVEFRSSDGEVQYPFGREPAGMLIYDPQGYVMVVLMRPDRPRFASSDLLGGTDEEVRAAFEGFEAYYGTYTLDPYQGIVTHRVTASRLPNWVATEQVRYIALSDEGLRLSTPPIIFGAKTWTVQLLWQRAT
jgi:hypothetical protein